MLAALAPAGAAGFVIGGRDSRPSAVEIREPEVVRARLGLAA